MKNDSFSSCFAPYMEAFIKEKKSLGFKYDTEDIMLHHFDRYCLIHCHGLKFDEKLVQGYIFADENQSVNTKQNYIGLMRQFAVYLTRQGLKSWIFPHELFPKKEQVYKPYIFTHDEISAIMQAAEKITFNPEFPTRYKTLPLLYRTLYCCGLRVSEATNLKVGKVDLQADMLSICNAKEYRDRVIPLSEELATRYKIYSKDVHANSLPSDFFFRSDYGNKYCTQAVEIGFRELLWKCGISYGGRSKGPNLHCLRHTFSVHSLQRAMKEGRELQEFLPVLSAYLDHKTLHGTERYLHMTAELYPDILDKLEEYCRGIIPKAGDFHE
jgi:integrase/recombinase XerD